MNTKRRTPGCWHSRGVRSAAFIAAAALIVSACGGDADADADNGVDEDTAETDADAEADGAAAGESGAFPLSTTNCGHEMEFDAPPERVLLLHTAPVQSLQRLGVLDRVVARAGLFPDEYFDEETQAMIDQVPSLVDQIDPDGHFELSNEAVVAEEPDLVMGENDGLTRESLSELGINQLLVPSQCPGATDSPDFDDVYELVEFYGMIFDRADEADVYVEELQERLDEITADIADEDRTAAALWPTIGGGTGFAYGNVSMTHTQLTAAGFTDVFEDIDERVFEVTLEEVIDRDPDVLLLLYSEGTPEQVEDAIRSLPGADGISAVQNDAIMTQLYNFSDPPTPLTIEGLERIVDFFSEP